MHSQHLRIGQRAVVHTQLAYATGEVRIFPLWPHGGPDETFRLHGMEGGKTVPQETSQGVNVVGAQSRDE